LRFKVQVLRPDGRAIEQEIEALSEAEARQQLQGQGFLVARVDVARQRLKVSFSLLLFTQELLALLDAGLSIVEAIETLVEKESRPDARALLLRIRDALFEGRTLSQALDLAGGFPPLYVSTVRASEKTSDLPEALQRYIAYQLQIEHMKKQLVSAAIYPVILLGVGALVIFFLLGYVVPKLAPIFEDNHNLPWVAQQLMNFGFFVKDHGLMLLVGLVATLAGLIYALSLPQVRRVLLSMMWQIGFIQSKWRVFELARLFRTVGMLLNGGIPAVAALNMVQGLLHPGLRPGLARAILAVSEGLPISDALDEHQLTTPVALRMLRVGERSGRLGDMMERIARFYDDDIARWLDWLTRLVSPLMMLFIGLVIGGIVFVLYMPIFELVGNLH
jgi:general secretion pathway protein F